MKDTVARRAAEVAPDTLIVGIDMARWAAHAAVFVTQGGQRVGRLSFPTTRAGFAALREAAEEAATGPARAGGERLAPAGPALRRRRHSSAGKRRLTPLAGISSTRVQQFRGNGSIVRGPS